MRTLQDGFLEHDLNPFIIFDGDGKLVNYNKEAEYLLSFVTRDELYELAVGNAPKDYGFKSSYVKLKFDRHIFYAILVGYIDEQKIGLKLYKEVSGSMVHIKSGEMSSSNLFTLLALSKNTAFANKEIKIKEIFDPTIPNIKLYIDKFLKLLNRVFSEYKESKNIVIGVNLQVGQSIVLNAKTYPICSIWVNDENSQIENIDALHALAQEAGCVLIVKKGKIKVEFPLIV